MRKAQDETASLEKSTKHLKRMPNLVKFFQKTEEERTFPNSFYEMSITLKPKTDKYTYKKKCKPIFLINIAAKILNKY